MIQGDFGPCDSLLGWKMSHGECVLISGCETEEHLFFATADDCRESCEPGFFFWRWEEGDRGKESVFLR